MCLCRALQASNFEEADNFAHAVAGMIGVVSRDRLMFKKIRERWMTYDCPPMKIVVGA